MAFQLVKYFYQKIRIYFWQRNLKKHAQAFQELFQQTNGFLLSRLGRRAHDTIDLVYGEIEFVPFIALLSMIKMDQDTVFYDLGSGTGKAVIATAMLYPIKKSIGVEILKDLHLAACSKKKQLAKHRDYYLQANKIVLVHGDFLEVDLNEATAIFINSSSLFNPTWSAICAKIDTLPHLQTVITTSKPLTSNKFLAIKTTTIPMSWGVVKAYIHHLKTNNN